MNSTTTTTTMEQLEQAGILLGWSGASLHSTPIQSNPITGTRHKLYQKNIVEFCGINYLDGSFTLVSHCIRHPCASNTAHAVTILHDTVTYTRGILLD